MLPSIATIVVLQRDAHGTSELVRLGKAHGLDVRSCETPSDAVALLTSSPTQALLTDLEPGETDRIAVIRAAREKNPPAQVVVVSGSPVAVRAVLQAQAISAEVLRGPASARDVLARIGEARRPATGRAR